MATKKKNNKTTISQTAFDDVVRENIEDLGMDPSEALQDAIETLTLQDVDLSGIVKCLPGETNPVVNCLENLKQFNAEEERERSEGDLVEVFDELAELCSGDSSGNAAIAARNGGVELVTGICERVFKSGLNDDDKVIVSGLKALASLLRDTQSAETFQKCGGPGLIIDNLERNSQNLELVDACFSVIAVAATGNEILKEAFMNLKVDEFIMKVLKGPNKSSIPSVYVAIRILLAADDYRVAASQVYGYARRFAKVGITEALVDSLREGLTSPSVVSASVALKAVVVNDEICRSVADKGGIDVVLRCIDDSADQGNNVVARTCCAVLAKLAGSDQNKSAIVEKGGLDRLIKLTSKFEDDPSVLQEVMYIIHVLCLRAPDNASRALEAGAGDLAIQAMEKFPTSLLVQKNACLMIRNLVVRNPENRKILLNNGIEKIIRKAKENHGNCKEAATDALRDLGLDNYNL